MSDWTAAIEEAYASAPADEFVISTLELIHSAFVDAEDNSDSIRAVLDNRAWELTLEDDAPLFAGQTKTFSPIAMKVSLPEQAENSMGALSIALDNVPRTYWGMLQNAARVRASARVIYREWVATYSAGSGYSVSGPPDYIVDQLTMRVVDANVLHWEGRAQFVDLINKKFPRRRFTRGDFPGLFGA